MPRTVQGSRRGCALHGAINAIEAVEGFVPIIHSNAGCGIQGAAAGSSGNCVGPFEIPSTNVSEKQVIFGGTSRLREQIKNTVRVINADLFVVTTGCSTEIVGDDIPAMTKEAQEQGFPVICISTPGFRGDTFRGYEILVRGVLEQLPKLFDTNMPKTKGLVNLLGIVPAQDVFWEGNIIELKRIIESTGLQVNALFGRGQDITQWRKIPCAELNLVVSPWGVNAAEYLKEKYGIPYVNTGSLPVGPDDIGRVLDILDETLGLDTHKLHTVKRNIEDVISYNLRKLAWIYHKHEFQKEFVIIGESFLVPGLLKFLHKYLGFIAKAAVITDSPPQNYKDYFKKEIEDLKAGYEIDLLYSEDLGDISDFIRKHDPELILGSYFEERIAAELKIPSLQISSPLCSKLILNKTYIGINGAVSLVEDIGNEVLGYRTKHLVREELI